MHWFQREGMKSFSTCAITQAGFIRLMLNPHLSEREVMHDEARHLLAELIRMKGHNFWNSNLDFLDATAPFSGRILGHRQVTDAYLLGLAIREKGILATLDRATRHLAGDEFVRHIFLIE
jgi:predicted nucleic acid-binding protein